jgi:hypothetical protein
MNLDSTLKHVGWIPRHPTQGFDFDALEGGEAMPKDWVMSPDWVWVKLYAESPDQTGDKQ